MCKVAICVFFFVFCSVCFSFTTGDGTQADPYVIESAAEFYEINDDLTAHYILASDLDLSGVTRTSAVIAPDNVNSGISFSGVPFSGSLNGNGHKITGLAFSNNYNGNYYVGLFGKIASEGIVENLVVQDCQILTVTHYGGGICAYNSGGQVINCHVSGSISGTTSVGGICGHNDYGQIISSSSECIINAVSYCGGLTGNDYGGSYSDCYADCEITVSAGRAGGLIGNSGDTVLGAPDIKTNIYRCYSAGWLIGISDHTGGLCGYFYNSDIDQCYSTMSVRGIGSDSDYVGGLCGLAAKSTITDSYNIGYVSGEGGMSDYIAGLLGYGGESTVISNCYSAAATRCFSSSPLYTGGAVAYAYSYNPVCQVNNCFWDSDLSFVNYDDYAAALPTIQMHTLSNFTDAGWDFEGESVNGTDDVWWMSSFGGYPQLSWQLKDIGMDKYKLLAMYWGETGCTSGADCYDADWYRDGTIDEYDLVRLSMSWLEKEVFIYEP
ncbi:MAG: hypothetical protein ACIAQZ_08940 [Sedimentisphaeraceae bacterium JB056]